MKRVLITEKPSVAKAVAEYLGVAKRHDGYIELKNGDAVTWQYGHLIGLAEPDEYLPEHLRGKFGFETLPIIPTTWKSVPKPETDRNGKVVMKNGKPQPSVQLGIVTSLLKKAEVIGNAGDIDREGQLVSDEVIEWAGFSPEGKNKPVERYLVTALDDASLKKTFAASRSNGEGEFVRRRYSAVARQRADWLTGMNGSRAYSISARSKVTVGRVQTPVGYLVYKRNLEVEQFKPTNYYVPEVTLPDGRILQWRGRKEGASMEGIDEEGRIVSRALAEAIVERIRAGLKGNITKAESDEGEEAPPLPFNMSALQVEMSKKYGLSASETMAVAQSLYERHKMISYVGTDCRYLPESMREEAGHVLQGISPLFPGLVGPTDTSIEYSCWNDSKVTAHHAIIPTGVASTGLDDGERKVFDAISKRYIAQFYPKYKFRSYQVACDFGEDQFAAGWSEPLVMGWKSVYGKEIESGGEDQEESQDHEHRLRDK